MRKFQAAPRTFLPLFIATLLTGVFSFASTNAHAGVIVNGFGFGTANVSGWSGVFPPPAAPFFTQSSGAGVLRPVARINSTRDPEQYATTAKPGDPGDPNGFRSTDSYAAATGAAYWHSVAVGMGFSGDDFSGDDPALFSLVTPSLSSAFVNLTVDPGTIVNSTTITFTGTFQGDAGTAAELSFSDISNSSSPTTLIFSDLTGPGVVQADGSLLFLGSGSGDPAQSFSFTIVDPAAASSSDQTYLQDYVQEENDFVAASVPEPSSILLLVGGVLAVARRRRNTHA